MLAIYFRVADDKKIAARHIRGTEVPLALENYTVYSIYSLLLHNNCNRQML